MEKCVSVCRTYDAIQAAYADMLSKDEGVAEFICNAPLEGLDYTTDFLCTKVDGTMMVRECVWQTHITKPMTVNLLEQSRQYWRRHGVVDWGIVMDEN